MNFNDVAIPSIKGNDYRIRFWYMSKDDVINIHFTLYKHERKNLLSKKQRSNIK